MTANAGENGLTVPWPCRHGEVNNRGGFSQIAMSVKDIMSHSLKCVQPFDDERDRAYVAELLILMMGGV